MSPSSKTNASDSFNEVATVRIELRDTDPVIWRQVEVPTSISLKVLHGIVQIVMGWFDYHLRKFTIAKQRGNPRRGRNLDAAVVSTVLGAAREEY